MDKAKKNLIKGAAIGVAAGAIAGAIAGILLAPKSGKETREDIAKYLGEMKDKIAKKLSDLKEISQDKYDEVVENVVGQYEKGKKISAAESRVIKNQLKEGYKEVKKAAKTS